MNQIQTQLNNTGKIYKKLYEIDRDVNNERLRHACVRVLFKYYEKECNDIRHIENKYDELESTNSMKNKNNKWREKLKCIYSAYNLDVKERKQFVINVCKELQSDIEEDFVIGWKTNDYLNKEITTVQNEKKEEHNDSNFYAIIYSSDGRIIEGATNWNLYV